MWKYRQEDPELGIKRFVGSDQAFANATGGTAAAITGLSIPVSAGEIWAIEAHILTTGVSGGGKFSVSGPASPALVNMVVKGPTSGITAYSTDTVTALDTLSAAYNTSAVTGEVLVLIQFSATANGTVQLNAANVTNSASFAVKAGSYLIANKLN